MTAGNFTTGARRLGDTMKTRLGHYDIVAELGRGGMGVVYKGHESSLNRYVAIKVLAESLAHDEGVKERFLREARSMAALNDPHIIQIYFIGEDEGQTYFVMEFVEGESLGTLLKRENKVATGPAAKIIYQTALGLATAHDKGVIHRDIKPGNLMVSSRGSIPVGRSCLSPLGICVATTSRERIRSLALDIRQRLRWSGKDYCVGDFQARRKWSSIRRIRTACRDSLSRRLRTSSKKPKTRSSRATTGGMPRDSR